MKNSTKKSSGEQYPDKPAHTQDCVAPLTYQCFHSLSRVQKRDDHSLENAAKKQKQNEKAEEQTAIPKLSSADAAKKKAAKYRERLKETLNHDVSQKAEKQSKERDRQEQYRARLKNDLDDDD
eukprot:12453659-Ditylum_brightwellii.AAC.1